MPSAFDPYLSAVALLLVLAIAPDETWLALEPFVVVHQRRMLQQSTEYNVSSGEYGTGGLRNPRHEVMQKARNSDAEGTEYIWKIVSAMLPFVLIMILLGNTIRTSLQEFVVKPAKALYEYLRTGLLDRTVEDSCLGRCASALPRIPPPPKQGPNVDKTALKPMDVVYGDAEIHLGTVGIMMGSTLKEAKHAIHAQFFAEAESRESCGIPLLEEDDLSLWLKPWNANRGVLRIEPTRDPRLVQVLPGLTPNTLVQTVNELPVAKFLIVRATADGPGPVRFTGPRGNQVPKLPTRHFPVRFLETFVNSLIDPEPGAWALVSPTFIGLTAVTTKMSVDDILAAAHESCLVGAAAGTRNNGLCLAAPTPAHLSLHLQLPVSRALVRILPHADHRMLVNTDHPALSRAAPRPFLAVIGQLGTRPAIILRAADGGKLRNALAEGEAEGEVEREAAVTESPLESPTSGGSWSAIPVSLDPPLHSPATRAIRNAPTCSMH